MKIISINIPPNNKAHEDLKNNFDNDKKCNCTRANRVVAKIKDEDPELIFFVEQFGPVYKYVVEKLRNYYKFIAPKNFKPNARSYAGVTCAIKKGIEIEKQIDGSDTELHVEQTAKILGLYISKKWFLGVHYPQPSLAKNSAAKKFDRKIKEFIGKRENNVQLIIGDFNPLQGTLQLIYGYRDVIDNGENTSLFKRKLDYIFVPESITVDLKKDVIFDTSVMEKDKESFFSDHVLSGVIFKEF